MQFICFISQKLHTAGASKIVELIARKHTLIKMIICVSNLRSLTYQHWFVEYIVWFEFALRCTRWDLIQININSMFMSVSSFWKDWIRWTIHTIVWYDKWWVNFDLTTLISINIITCMLSDIQRAKSIILWVVQSYYTTCTYSVKSYLSISADANKYIRLYGYTNKNINATIDQFMIKIMSITPNTNSEFEKPNNINCYVFEKNS